MLNHSMSEVIARRREIQQPVAGHFTAVRLAPRRSSVTAEWAA
jgi:hypothetical protein